MLTSIIRYLHSFKNSPLPILGRWCNMDKTKNNLKVDMANTDHCGTCSYDAIKKNHKTTGHNPTDIKYVKNTKSLY